MSYGDDVIPTASLLRNDNIPIELLHWMANDIGCRDNKMVATALGAMDLLTRWARFHMSARRKMIEALQLIRRRVITLQRWWRRKLFQRDAQLERILNTWFRAEGGLTMTDLSNLIERTMKGTAKRRRHSSVMLDDIREHERKRDWRHVMSKLERKDIDKGVMMESIMRQYEEYKIVLRSHVREFAMQVENESIRLGSGRRRGPQLVPAGPTSAFTFNPERNSLMQLYHTIKSEDLIRRMDGYVRKQTGGERNLLQRSTSQGSLKQQLSLSRSSSMDASQLRAAAGAAASPPTSPVSLQEYKAFGLPPALSSPPTSPKSASSASIGSGVFALHGQSSTYISLTGNADSDKELVAAFVKMPDTGPRDEKLMWTNALEAYFPYRCARDIHAIREVRRMSVETKALHEKRKESIMPAPLDEELAASTRRRASRASVLGGPSPSAKPQQSKTSERKPSVSLSPIQRKIAARRRSTMSGAKKDDGDSLRLSMSALDESDANAPTETVLVADRVTLQDNGQPEERRTTETTTSVTRVDGELVTTTVSREVITVVIQANATEVKQSELSDGGALSTIQSPPEKGHGNSSIIELQASVSGDMNSAAARPSDIAHSEYFKRKSVLEGSIPMYRVGHAEAVEPYMHPRVSDAGSERRRSSVAPQSAEQQPLKREGGNSVPDVGASPGGKGDRPRSALQRRGPLATTSTKEDRKVKPVATEVLLEPTTELSASSPPPMRGFNQRPLSATGFSSKSRSRRPNSATPSVDEGTLESPSAHPKKETAPSRTKCGIRRPASAVLKERASEGGGRTRSSLVSRIKGAVMHPTAVMAVVDPRAARFTKSHPNVFRSAMSAGCLTVSSIPRDTALDTAKNHIESMGIL